MISTTQASAATPAMDAGASAERADRANEDEKKARRKQFLTGLKGTNPGSTEARPTPARTTQAKAQTAAGEPGSAAAQSDSKAVKGAERSDGEAKRTDGAGVEGVEEKAPEDGLIHVLVRRGVSQNARRVLRQRVAEHAPKLADSNPVDGRAAQARDLEQERKLEKKSVVEAAQHDPEVAVRAGQVATDPRIARNDPPVIPLRTDHPVSAATFRQMVAFAEVHTDRSGVIEFKLGLQGAVLGGAKIVIRALGQRKIGLGISNSSAANSASKAVTAEDVKELVEALRRRDLEVVDVLVT